jgi:hypothetical protein
MKKLQKQILANQKQNLDAIYKVKALINYKLKAKEANMKQKNF